MWVELGVVVIVVVLLMSDCLPANMSSVTGTRLDTDTGVLDAKKLLISCVKRSIAGALDVVLVAVVWVLC